MNSLTRRNFLSRSVLAAAAVNTTPFWTPTARATMPMPDAGSPLDAKLDAYIARYMPAMNAPGLTLGLTSAEATLRTVGYGFADTDRKTPVTTDHLFQIGSITKSFVALVLMQMRDEGKLELQKPILAYLPWLPITEPFGVITPHHLLTHTSGLPDNQSIFSSDPAARLAQGFTPGEHFHYCNAGFDILGKLAATLDRRSWRECVTERILKPLGMHDTRPIVTTADRDRFAVGYEPFWDDEVYPRQGRLTAAPWLVMDDTAGCIASTPGDMATYTRMLLNHGKHAGGRIASEESFTLFSTPYIKADDFSPTASYGYGIAVDTLDGHKILRHTGGMVAFASSIHVDLDGGVAAFASINAMQGYRPTAVTEYAVQLLRAQQESKPLPDAADIPDPLEAENAADYAGSFSTPAGKQLSFAVQGKRLSLVAEGKTIPLQHQGGDQFISTIPGVYSKYMFAFGRKHNDAGEGEGTAPLPLVVQVAYGSDLYVNKDWDGPRVYATLPFADAFAGHYRSDSAWGGDARVYVLNGRLMLDGTPLVPLGDRLFRVSDVPWMPDTVEFHHVVDGKAQLMKSGGLDFWRVEVD
ncbi:serine hydrolase domain-containing protein [Acidicapsa dinghuensis]|uniref:Serine hydrolase domain-containing protein n=1 Tax=Acidicapsa dinghuensis TaxID=2218256 RepID=A0ABW1EK07_9BACT|nr:serine hydrolase domain-containing protein [Acidicapsa dinghuensis]